MQPEVIGYLIGMGLMAWLGSAMAKSRKRSQPGWAIGFAVFGLAALLVLLLIGKAEEAE